MATTKARVEELEAIVEHLQERVDRLRDFTCGEMFDTLVERRVDAILSKRQLDIQQLAEQQRQITCGVALEERLSELEKQISKFEKKMPTLPYKYGCQVREYINDKVEREVDEKSHANLIAIINFISALSGMPKGKSKKVK